MSEVKWKEFDFRDLSPEQEQTALQREAFSRYRRRLVAAEVGDWWQAAGQLERQGNPYPYLKNEKIAPLAQEIFEKRMAEKTDDDREKAKNDDWLTAESNLRSGRVRCYLPAVRWGEYAFEELTPEQKHFAINGVANNFYLSRVEHASIADWYEALNGLRRATPNPHYQEIKAEAQTLYEKRMSQQTEAERLAEAQKDWRHAESWLKDLRSTYLPVSMVSHMRPMHTTLRAA